MAIRGESDIDSIIAEARQMQADGRYINGTVFHALVTEIERLRACVVETDGHRRTIEWPDPTPEMLETPEFEAVWQCIRTWDINVPAAYSGYCGATGNHVRAILDALGKCYASGDRIRVNGRWYRLAVSWCLDREPDTNE